MKKEQNGNSLIVVIIVIAVTSLLAASIASFISTQRKIALHSEISSRAMYAAESATDYAVSILRNQVKSAGTINVDLIPTTQPRAFNLPESAVEFITGTGNSRTVQDTSSKAEITINQIMIGVPENEQKFQVSKTDPANAGKADAGKWVKDRIIPITVKATAQINGISRTVYIQRKVGFRQTSLSQSALFFQNELQMHRGFNILGTIDANSDVIINTVGGESAKFTKISTAGRFIRDSFLGTVGGIARSDGFGYSKSGITTKYLGNTNNANIEIYSHSEINASGARISRYTPLPIYPQVMDNSGIASATAPAMSIAEWKEQSKSLFKDNLLDSASGVTTLTPEGFSGYSRDNSSSTNINEFNNSNYSLIEPVLPNDNPVRIARDNDSLEKGKIAAKAGLILRIEANSNFIPRKQNGDQIELTDKYRLTAASGNVAKQVANRGERFVIKAYKVTTDATGNRLEVPIDLPSNIIGTASSDITRVETNKPYQESVTYNGNTVTTGLHDARSGRGVEPFTLDMEKFKTIVEGNSSEAQTFRANMGLSEGVNSWNGIVYVEAPTSLTPDLSRTNTHSTNGIAITSNPFLYNDNPETRNPDRLSEEYRGANRTDNVVPIAPELRKYPTPSSEGTVTNTQLQDPQYAIPALQIINASNLPNEKTNGNQKQGFTLATNLPIYLIGNFNSNGNTKDNVNFSTYDPATPYASEDSNEIPAALYADTLTTLSETWKTANRANSFYGQRDAGDTYRKVQANQFQEISASVMVGDYPIYEFFNHVLESYKLHYTARPSNGNPILFRGSLNAMFHSEISDIKQAYGRDVAQNVEAQSSHSGGWGYADVAFGRNLAEDRFPPGTPASISMPDAGFLLLRPSIQADAAIITAAGISL